MAIPTDEYEQAKFTQQMDATPGIPGALPQPSPVQISPLPEYKQNMLNAAALANLANEEAYKFTVPKITVPVPTAQEMVTGGNVLSKIIGSAGLTETGAPAQAQKTLELIGEEPTPTPGPVAKSVAGVWGATSKSVESFQEPEMAIPLAIGFAFPPSAPIIAGYFEVQMMKNAPVVFDQWKQSLAEGDPEKIAGATTDMALNALFMLGAGKGMTGKAPRPTMAEMEAAVMATAKQKGGQNVRFVDDFTGPQEGQLAYVDANGTTLINRGEMMRWVAQGKGKLTKAMREGLLTEERIHQQVKDLEKRGIITDNDIKDYWDGLSPAEQEYWNRIYTGQPGGMPEFSKYQMGHEAIRGRLQQLSRLTPRETAEARLMDPQRLERGSEWLTMQTYWNLTRFLGRMRETFKKDSPNAKLIDKIRKNLDGKAADKGFAPVTPEQLETGKAPEAAPAAPAPGVASEDPFAFRKITEEIVTKEPGEKVMLEVLGTNPAEIVNQWQGFVGNPTEAMYTIGRKASKNPDAITTLARAYAEASNPETMRSKMQEAFKAGDNATIQGIGFKQQVLGEMLEGAVGADKFKGKNNPKDDLQFYKRMEGAFEQANIPIPDRYAAMLDEKIVGQYLSEEFGVKSGKGIRLYRDKLSGVGGESNIAGDGTLEEIAINLEGVNSLKDVSYIVEHELAHGADYHGGVTERIQKSFRPDELQNILSDIAKSNYDFSKYNREVNARQLHLLAQNWKTRPWFEKVVGVIMDMANRIGFKMGRMGAERAAAKAIADATIRLSKTQPPRPAVREFEETAPAAFRKPSPEDKLQPALPLAAPPPGKPPERPTEQQLGPAFTPQPVTPVALQTAAQKHLQESDRPSFRTFVADAQDQFGGRVQPGQLTELWEDAVWKRLLTAKGAELESLINELGLRERVGKAPIPDETPAEAKVAAEAVKPTELDPAYAQWLDQINALEQQGGLDLRDPSQKSEFDRLAQESVKLRRELRRPNLTTTELQNIRGKLAEWNDIREASALMNRMKISNQDFRVRYDAEQRARLAEAAADRYEKGKAPGQNRRALAIARIAEKLIKESAAPETQLRRGEVDPESIGWWREQRGQEPAYRSVLPEEASGDVKALGKILTSGASVERVGRKAPVESVTKRITALHNNETGRVHLVSTYQTGRGEFYIFDPYKTLSKRPHVRLSELLDQKMAGGKPRWTVTDSYLLDEPVQSFHQRFDSLEDYQNKFRDPVASEYESRKASELEAPPIPEAIEPAPGEEGEAAPSPEEIPPVPSVMRTGTPMTEAEARRLYDFFAGGEPKNRGEIVTAFEQLFKANRPTDPKTRKPKALDAQEIAVVNAIDKMVQARKERAPDLDELDAINDVLSLIYEKVTSPYQTRQSFIDEVLQEFPEEGGGPAQGTPEAAIRARERESQRRGVTREFTMRDRIPPTVIRGEVMPKRPGPKAELTEGPRSLSERLPEYKAPAAFVKPRAIASMQEKVAAYRDGLRAIMLRRPTKNDIIVLRDGLDTEANIEGQRAERSIDLRTTSPVEDAAVIVMVQSRRSLNAVADFRDMVNRGLAKARAANSPRMIDAGEQMLAAIDYAERNWTKSSLRSAASEFERWTKQIYDLEKANGARISYETGYVPQRWDAELFNDNEIMFGEQGALGRAYKKAKVFRNYFEGYEAGFLPKKFQASAILGSRIRDGMKSVNRRLWAETWKDVIDPDTIDPDVPGSGEPIVKDMIDVQIKDSLGNLIRTEPKVPDPNYVPIKISAGRPVAVRKGYRRLFEALTARSQFADSPLGEAALFSSAWLKHRFLLLDTFHVGRMEAMGASLMGRKMGWNKGVALLEHTPEDLLLAYQRNAIPKEFIEWILDIDPDMVATDAQGNIRLDQTVRLNRNTIEVNDITLGRGAKTKWTNSQAAQFLIRRGLNVGRIQDALYRDMIREIPYLGQMSKWIFDKLSRGLMMEAALLEFQRLNKAKPGMDPTDIARAVAKDTNVYFGNLGRQGLFQNPTMRDLLQLPFLAPQWVESLIQKEMRAAGRVATAPFKGKDQIKFGTIGKGVGAGIGASILLTQMASLLINHKFTWQESEDPEHKLDLHVPDVTGKSDGLWVSPLAIYAEITHDLIRYGFSEDQALDAGVRIMENKMGPIARSIGIGLTGRDPLKGRLDSSWSRVKQAALTLIPIPIGVGPGLRTVGHAVLPSKVQANRPAAVQRQLMGSVGIKAEFSRSPTQIMGRKAKEWQRKEGKVEKVVIEATEAPSYSKLRDAIRRDDLHHASRIIEELLTTNTPDEIHKAMKLHMERPFTGNKLDEVRFVASLSDAEEKIYQRAKEQQNEEYSKFLEIWSNPK